MALIEQRARVTRVQASQVWLQSAQSGACGVCPQRPACGTAVLADWLPRREFALDSDLALQAGDEVMVAVEERYLLLVSLLMYLAPLLLMLAGVGAAAAWLPPDWQEGLPLLALTVLLGYFFVAHRVQAWWFLGFGGFRLQVLRRCRLGEI